MPNGILRLKQPCPIGAKIDDGEFSPALRPALVVGDGVDRDGAWDLAVQLADRYSTPVWVSPNSGRCSFPESHPLFAGFLPPSKEGSRPCGVRKSAQLGGNDVLHALTREAADAIAVQRALLGKDKLCGFKAFRYGAKNWDTERRFVARIEATPKGLDVRYVVTSLELVLYRETGAITIAQAPNLSLWIAMASGALIWAWHPPDRLGVALEVIFKGALFVWAVDEVLRIDSAASGGLQR